MVWSQPAGHQVSRLLRRSLRLPLIARQAGIEDARGDLLPEAELDPIRDMQQRYGAVGMTGDGINDRLRRRLVVTRGTVRCPLIASLSER